MKREESYVRVSKWQGGKLSDLVHPASELILSIRDFADTRNLFFRNGTDLVEFIQWNYQRGLD